MKNKHFHKWLPSSIRYKLYYEIIDEAGPEIKEWYQKYQEDLEGAKRYYQSINQV